MSDQMATEEACGENSQACSVGMLLCWIDVMVADTVGRQALCRLYIDWWSAQGTKGHSCRALKGALQDLLYDTVIQG